MNESMLEFTFKNLNRFLETVKAERTIVINQYVFYVYKHMLVIGETNDFGETRHLLISYKDLVDCVELRHITTKETREYYDSNGQLHTLVSNEYMGEHLEFWAILNEHYDSSYTGGRGEVISLTIDLKEAPQATISNALELVKIINEYAKSFVN